MKIKKIFGMTPEEFMPLALNVLVGLATLACALLLFRRQRRKKEEQRISHLLHHRKPK